MSEDEVDSVAMAECGACRAVIPIDSESCPECDTKFSGISEDALGECGGCQALVPLDSTRCPECGVLFVADDVVDILRQWVADTGINIRKLFDRFDENSDGTIDSSELKQGLLSLNLADLPPSQVDRLVAEIDADGNGLIDLDEFDAILSGDEVEPSSEPSSEPEEHDDETSPQGDEEIDDEVVVEIDTDEGQTNEEEDVDVEAENEVISSDIDDEEFDLEEDVDADEDDDLDAAYVDDSSDEEEGEEVDDEPSEESEGEESAKHPLAALAAMMDEHDISAQRMFNELDVDGNGAISLVELRTALTEKYGDVLDIDDVDAIMEAVDDDEDGLIDITEFYDSMESLDDHEEAVIAHEAEKEFPTVWQKRMMSKSWNDAVWPILHVGFGILIALVLVNALFGPVDGSGGNVAYIPNDSGLIPEGGLSEGDIYKCDEKYQEGGCPNSLTIMGGPDSNLSMPKGFYLDGIMLLMLSTLGLIGSLFLHLVKAPEWRARAKAMKEFEEDKADASQESEDEVDVDEEEVDETETDEEASEGPEDEDEEDDESEDDDDDVEDGEDEDAIDIGSHIGLVFDDEEVFGVIVEFDDEEETVTIEEDGTGDLVTGYQEDMFIE
ncbi:MAG: EF-hand domain-containing protein [Candidatus Poseidoniales archaeon]